MTAEDKMSTLVEKMTPRILTASGYCFQPLNALDNLKSRIEILGRRHLLRGTILVSSEGINCTVAGAEPSVKMFQSEVNLLLGRPIPDFRESYADALPFKRFLVKIKKEIITMGVALSEQSLANDASHYIEPKDLAARLRRGDKIMLLDTRNDYEVGVGTFIGAKDYNIESFTRFAENVDTHLSELEGAEIVTFCTGGIRCEKVARFMADKIPSSKIYQIRGGILNYFRECGGEHWQGDCFVFDERVAVTPALKPSGHRFCADCGNPVMPPVTHCRECISPEFSSPVVDQSPA